MKYVVIILFSMLMHANVAMCTETLDCANDKYLFRMHVGSTGYFGDVLVYEQGKTEYISIKRVGLKVAHLNWKKKELKLDHESVSKDLPSFIIDVNGKSHGTLLIDGANSSIKCDW